MCLSESELNGTPTFIKSDIGATQYQLCITELDSVHPYYIELISHTGTFHYYSLYIIQEVVYCNEPVSILHLLQTGRMWNVAPSSSFV